MKDSILQESHATKSLRKSPALLGIFGITVVAIRSVVVLRVVALRRGFVVVVVVVVVVLLS